MRHTTLIVALFALLFLVLNAKPVASDSQFGRTPPPTVFKNQELVFSPVAKKEYDRVVAMPFPKIPRKLDFRHTVSGTRQHDFVFFLHIPKTGGMTMVGILTQHFHPKALTDGSEKQQPGKPGGFWGRLRFDPNFVAGPTVLQMLTSPNQFLRTYDSYKGAYGHSDVSVELALGDRETVFITMIRKPEDQLISWYHFLMQYSGRGGRNMANAKGGKSRFDGVVNGNHHLTLGSLDKEVTLADFAEGLEKLHLTNYQTRAYAGNLPWSMYNFDTKFSMLEALEIAKERLRRMTWVGLTERYADSLVMLQYAFDVSIPAYSKRNSSPKYKPPEAHVLERIKELQWVDSELYKFAEELFEERWQAMHADCKKRGVPVPSPPNTGLGKKVVRPEEKANKGKVKK